MRWREISFNIFLKIGFSKVSLYKSVFEKFDLWATKNFGHDKCDI